MSGVAGPRFHSLDGCLPGRNCTLPTVPTAQVLQRFTRQFGPVFKVQGPPWSPAAVFVSTPEAVKHVLNGFQTGAEGGGVYGKGDFFRAQVGCQCLSMPSGRAVVLRVGLAPNR